MFVECVYIGIAESCENGQFAYIRVKSLFSFAENAFERLPIGFGRGRTLFDKAVNRGQVYNRCVSCNVLMNYTANGSTSNFSDFNNIGLLYKIIDITTLTQTMKFFVSAKKKKKKKKKGLNWLI